MTDQPHIPDPDEPPQPEPEPEPDPAAEPETSSNVNGEVVDEALVNSWVVDVPYNNPADPDGPEGPEGPPEGEPAEG